MKTSAPEDFEVLPPERSGMGISGSGGGRAVAGQHQALTQLIAYLMDNLVKIPGVQKKVGINPLLDIIPFGVGDAAATIAQMFTILEAGRRGVPKIVQTRMVMNVLLNGAVGVIPVVGEAFSWWFRPSSRNYNLLLKHAPQTTGSMAPPARKSTAGDKLFVFGLLAMVLVVMGMFIALGWLILSSLWHLAGSHL